MTEAGSALPSTTHAACNLARLDAVLDQAGDHDASIRQERIETGASSRAMGEHFAGPSVRIEPDRDHEARAVVLELQRSRRRVDREVASASSHASLGLDCPQQDGERIGLVVVGRCEPASANRSDDRVLVGVTLAGDEPLDGADGHALVGDPTVIAPGGQVASQTAITWAASMPA